MSLTAEQRAIRSHGIGSSDIAAVCGLSPFRSPMDVWMDKTGKRPADPDTGRAAAGRALEAAIAELYKQEVELRDGRKIEWLIPDGGFTHAKDWRVATPDRVSCPAGPYEPTQGRFAPQLTRITEIKLVGWRVASHWSEGPPDYVRVQNLWQQDVFDIHRGDVAVLLGTDFQIHEVPWDADLAKSLREIGEEFWFKHVKADEPPPVDASDAWAEYVKSKYPRHRGDDRPRASAVAEKWADNLIAATTLYSSAEKLWTQAETALKDLIGDSAGLLGGSWSISYKNDKSGGVDYKGALEHVLAEGRITLEQHAELITNFTRPGPRKFRFTHKDSKKEK